MVAEFSGNVNYSSPPVRHSRNDPDYRMRTCHYTPSG